MTVAEIKVENMTPVEIINSALERIHSDSELIVKTTSEEFNKLNIGDIFTPRMKLLANIGGYACVMSECCIRCKAAMELMEEENTT